MAAGISPAVVVGPLILLGLLTLLVAKGRWWLVPIVVAAAASFVVMFTTEPSESFQETTTFKLIETGLNVALFGGFGALAYGIAARAKPGSWWDRRYPPSQQTIETTQPPKRRWNGALIAAAVFAVIAIVNIASWLTTRGAEETPDIAGALPGDDEVGAEETPDFAGALPGDDEVGPLPLGSVNELPGEDYLNFLFEFCDPNNQSECFRDAHFMDPNNPQVGSGPWTAGRPFHVRHGFINHSDEPLGEGFDVVIYVTRTVAGEADPGLFELDRTYRFTSDYVLRGTSDQCGPTYKSQTGSQTCEWFVHDFPDGLPEGGFALWALWEARCSAWVDLGFTATCDDPDQVISLFSSAVDSPFGESPPSFTEVNGSSLTPDD